jgi:hypothetical protein
MDFKEQLQFPIKRIVIRITIHIKTFLKILIEWSPKEENGSSTPLFFKKWASYRLYHKWPPRIVNRTVPKIIVISVHTVNRFPLSYYCYFWTSTVKVRSLSCVEKFEDSKEEISRISKDWQFNVQQRKNNSTNNDLQIIRPKKIICVFPIDRPTLKFYRRP